MSALKHDAVRNPAILILVLLLGQSLVAQTPVADQPAVQPPRRPSISPYLNLGIENSGALPSYQAFVLPRKEQQKQMLNQYLQQAKAISSAKSEIAEHSLRQTGLGGKYQNYSHFYSVQRPRTNHQHQ